jgi:hypothetical protein
VAGFTKVLQAWDLRPVATSSSRCNKPPSRPTGPAWWSPRPTSAPSSGRRKGGSHSARTRSMSVACWCPAGSRTATAVAVGNSGVRRPGRPGMPAARERLLSAVQEESGRPPGHSPDVPWDCHREAGGVADSADIFPPGLGVPFSLRREPVKAQIRLVSVSHPSYDAFYGITVLRITGLQGRSHHA